MNFIQNNSLALAAAGIACIQTLILYGQWRVYRRQNEHFRNSERAWIIVSPKDWNPGLHAVDPKVGGPIPLNMFEAVIKNVGKTPAQIVSTAIQYVTVDDVSKLSLLPHYDQKTALDLELLVPHDSFGQIALLSPAASLSPIDVSQISNGHKSLYAYGFVRYTDVFGASRHTNWGYVYEFPQGFNASIYPPRFRRAGPPPYNSAI